MNACRWWIASLKDSKYFNSQIAVLTAAQNTKPELPVVPKETKAEKKDEDWWMSSTYKGKSFAL